MFGFRPDGRRVSSIDPIVGITPYLMPMRCDAQVFLQHRVDYELLTRYIAAQAAKGEKITFMQIITAAFVRTVSQHPEINRFILNKQFFARNMCAVSFTMLKNPQNAEMGETAVKVKYDLTDTIYDVRDRMEKVINANRGEDKKNFADKLAKAVLVVPGLATGIVALVRLLDRYGLCPGALLDELPFHTSMYITNNASIGLHHVNHHIYNFGSVTLFFGMDVPKPASVMPSSGSDVASFSVLSSIGSDTGALSSIPSVAEADAVSPSRSSGIAISGNSSSSGIAVVSSGADTSAVSSVVFSA